MSTPQSTTSKSGASLLWLLTAFFGFAVLFYLVQSLFGRAAEDPRSGDRLAFKKEVLAEQAALLDKMGLNSPASRKAVFDKTVISLKSRKPAKSAFVVPGSPTQLKQMAAEAPPPAADAKPADAPPAK